MNAFARGYPPLLHTLKRKRDRINRPDLREPFPAEFEQITRPFVCRYAVLGGCKASAEAALRRGALLLPAVYLQHV